MQFSLNRQVNNETSAVWTRPCYPKPCKVTLHTIQYLIVPSTVVHTQKKIQHFQFTYQQQLGQLDAQQYEYVGLFDLL
jgi:hypothetical protein